jgi:hypothetical protein
MKFLIMCDIRSKKFLYSNTLHFNNMHMREELSLKPATLYSLIFSTHELRLKNLRKIGVIYSQTFCCRHSQVLGTRADILIPSLDMPWLVLGSGEQNSL